MTDKDKFLEMLKEIMEVASVQNNRISKEELAKMLGKVELSDEQYQAVYAYLAENRIEVEGYIYIPPKKEVKIPEEEKVSAEDSLYLKMYKEELQEVEHLSKEEKEALIREVAEGKEDNIQQLINGYLHDVLAIVQKYKNKGVRVEDLIQEGNMGLIVTVDNLAKQEEVSDDYLLKAIEDAVITAIDEMKNKESEEDAIVAKANLIREAAKYLEEDGGRAPSIAELEKYTKIPQDEIRDILNLSKEK